MKDPSLYAGPKIVVVKTGATCVAALDSEGLVTMQSLYNLHLSTDMTKPESLLGVLNSRFARFYITKTCTLYKTLFPQMNQSSLESIPVPRDCQGKQTPLVHAVQQMLDLNKRLAAANTEEEKTVLRRQIEATDRQIDALVYELYGLTDEEIALVENAC